MKKIRIFYLYPLPRSEILREGTINFARKSLFYGLDCLYKHNIKADYSDNGFRSGYIPFLARKLSAFFQIFFDFPIDFSHIIISFRKILKSDIIFATSQRQGLPLALLKYFKIIRKPIVFCSIGFSELLKERFNANIVFFRKIFKCTDKIICYGWQEKEDLKTLLNLDDKKVKFFPFGVDTDFFTPSNIETKDFILSVGNDNKRDYQTLLLAMRGLSINLLIITAPENMEGLIVSENIKVYYRVPYIQLKEFYSQSRFVILPVKDNSYSGGTTTLLEAMALAKAVIVSYTGGIKKGYHLRHNGNCFLVTPGNVEELKEAIQYLYSHPEECFRIGSNARRSVEVHNSWNIYVNRLVGIFKEVYK